jgi:hypothetical protein
VFLHYLETVVVSGSTIAYTALYYAFNNFQYSAVVSEAQIITITARSYLYIACALSAVTVSNAASQCVNCFYVIGLRCTF